MTMIMQRCTGLLLACALAACGNGGGSGASAPSAPAIASFDADAGSVAASAGGLLRWDVRGASSVRIAPDVGNVDGAGSVRVTPAQTTAYTLTATDAQGHQISARVTLNVNQAHAAPAAYPILFVTQVPVSTDVAARLSAFANHLGGIAQVPRGGDLMLRYPDGALRNLTREAGLGMDGLQGAGAIAVREPSVHWSGSKAVFSMLVGAPAGPRDVTPAFWQMYEVSGLAQGQTARISRVANQPERYNNLSPLYGSDERLLFTSDRPPGGLAQLYPQLDEYEATPTTTGIWRLDPASGALTLLNQAVSGAFSPFIDSYGRVLFTRWDHLQQDQLAQRDRDALGNGVALPFNSFNFASESADAAPLATRIDSFPESRSGDMGPYGRVNAFAANFFTIWQINEDGTGEETLNHVGQHELAFGFLTPSFRDDPALQNHTDDTLHANRLALRRDGGLFHLREDPQQPGSYLGTAARENGAFTTNQIVRLSGAPGVNPERMVLTAVTAGDAGDVLPGGRFRNPLPLSDGRLLASHTSSSAPPEPGSALKDLRLRFLAPDPVSGLYAAGAPLTDGIAKSLSWWSPAGLQTYSGPLWELEAVEVRARARPSRAPAPLEAPERAVLAAEHVSEAALRAWLVAHQLALIVTRDQTSRDQAERQQPFNLQVPGGVKTVARDAPDARLYQIAHFQIFQGDALRAYPGRPGRRVLAVPLHDAGAANPPNPEGPSGSVRIAPDGSTAAFVPAARALTWQSTDPAFVPIVRERNWITLQAGEMRSCPACHGVNSVNQAGLAVPTNPPQALRDLLRHWKTLPK